MKQYLNRALQNAFKEVLKFTGSAPIQYIFTRFSLNKPRLKKKDVIEEICSRVETYYDEHPLEAKLKTKQAAYYQKNYFKEKISSLEKKINATIEKPKKKKLTRILQNYERDMVELDDCTADEAISNLSRYYIEDIAADFDPVFFVLFREIARNRFPNLYKSIDISSESEDTFERIRKIQGKHPLVFVPNHVSNADHVPICVAMNKNGLYHPLIAAGANLFKGLSETILHKVNAYKIRREYIGRGLKEIMNLLWFQNPIYRKVHNEYLRYAWDKNEPFLFYIEGTRSRDGKVGKAKIGLLKTMIDYVKETGREMFFVPVSISYTIVPEDLEIEKSRNGENISKGDLIVQLAKLNHEYENLLIKRIPVRFSDPIPIESGIGKIKEPVSQIMNKIKEGIQPTSTYMLASALNSILSGLKERDFSLDSVLQEFLLNKERYGVDESDISKSIYNACQAFSSRGFIEEYESGERFRILKPEMIEQYANRIQHMIG